MSICKYCKHVSEDGTRFCKVCGKALDVFPDTPEPQPPEPKPLQNTPNTFPMNDKDRQAYAEKLQNQDLTQKYTIV